MNNTVNRRYTVLSLMGAIMLSASVIVYAQVVPPDPTVCDGVTCQTLQRSTCTPAGYVFSLIGFTPAPSGTTGQATYTYQICNPTAGTCVGTKTGTSCEANDTCWPNKCQQNGPNARKCSQDNSTTCTTDAQCNDVSQNYCSGKTVNGQPTECVPDTIKGLGLSHFDVTFPALGTTCLGSGTAITGSCSATGGASVGNFVLGDGSCFGPTSPVAKCDNTNLPAGSCITMTLDIPGELNKPGLGVAVVVDKEGSNCQAECLAGPSCTPCEQLPSGEACLTRTLGFWGTHPWVTNNYVPVTVCGGNYSLGCSGPDDGKSSPACLAGTCDSVMEGLGSTPGTNLPSNPPYVAMIKQLTAAKLNLNATAALFNGANCSSWKYQDKTIQEWLAICDTTSMCSANKATISNSGCIEALTAFNSDQDTGFDVTPSPFDRPSVDDHGNISGADPSQFNAAGKSLVVIGKGTCAAASQ